MRALFLTTLFAPSAIPAAVIIIPLAVVTVCIHLVGNGRESDPLRSRLMSRPNERGRVKALKKKGAGIK